MDTHFANMRSLIQVRAPGMGMAAPHNQGGKLVLEGLRGGLVLGSRRDNRSSKDSLEQCVPGKGGRSWCSRRAEGWREVGRGMAGALCVHS